MYETACRVVIHKGKFQSFGPPPAPSVKIAAPTFDQSMEWAFNNPFASDIQFIVDSKILYCHKVLGDHDI